MTGKGFKGFINIIVFCYIFMVAWFYLGPFAASGIVAAVWSMTPRVRE